MNELLEFRSFNDIKNIMVEVEINSMFHSFIESFEAFHSLISGVPGAMFIFVFNSNKGAYKEAFANACCQETIQQAGDNYITGGNEGLYTRIYRACCCRGITDEGVIAGEIGTPQTIGSGKKEALIKFCNQKKISTADCYAYGDDLSDIPMLESVGYPVCVGKYTELARHAINQRWQVI